ncbi:MAG: SprT-like domain-containing protein [Rhodothermia bacterium]|nr:SprT-like domain-containing protein [Rhodothermia bacterium]
MSQGSPQRSNHRVVSGRQLSLNFQPAARRRVSRSKNGRVRLSPAVQESLGRISIYLPPRSRPFVARILTESPTEVFPVEARESKHGDFMAIRGRPFGQITVNVCGNPYQFLLTLLHEIAHARVHATHRRYVQPHGAHWKEEFAGLLDRLVRTDVLPADLRRVFRIHSENPKSTADYDTELQLALRRYDTLDRRMLVADLRDGDLFSLDGKTVLRKGELIRRRIRCVATNGHIYSVLPTARVREIYSRE